jgi:hypothetical protein
MKGKIFMTHATKEVYNIFFLDVVKMKMDLVEDILYDKHLLAQVLPKRW